MSQPSAQAVAAEEALSLARLYLEAQGKSVERLRTLLQALLTVGVGLNSLLAKTAFERDLTGHWLCAVVSILSFLGFAGFALWALRLRDNMLGRPRVATFDGKPRVHLDREKLLIAKGVVAMGDKVRESAKALNQDFLLACGILIASLGGWLWLILQTTPE